MAAHVCHRRKNHGRCLRINEDSGSQSRNWLPEMCGRLLRPTERVLHRLDSQAAILIKEHRWLVVVAHYTSSVSSTHYERETLSADSAGITRVITVNAHVFGKQVESDDSCPFRKVHLFELFEIVAVHRECPKVPLVIERLSSEAIRVSVQKHRFGRADGTQYGWVCWVDSLWD